MPFAFAGGKDYFCKVKAKDPAFRFKQFSLRQERSAMKIGTDGVLLGAWCDIPRADAAIWDAGCGTGLIALMMAQRCDARITGIEIDPEAAAEAAENATRSPWGSRVEIVCGNITEIASALPRPDLIVSNPPYFNTTLQSPEQRRASARHEGSLSYESLTETAAEYLAEKGKLCLIAPADRFCEIEESIYMHKLNIQRICTVKAKENAGRTRVMLTAGREAAEIEKEELAIRDSHGNYTSDYIELTKNFYTGIKDHVGI